MEEFYIYINYIAPIAVLFFVGFFLGKGLFFSENYKKIRITGSLPQKIFQFTIRLIAVALTAIILAIMSVIVLIFVGLGAGIYSVPSLQPTYGTPVYRPKIK